MGKHLISILAIANAALIISACGPKRVQGPPMRAYVVSSMSGVSQKVLNQAVSDIEEASGDAFMSDPESDYPIVIRYGKLTGLQIGLATTNLEDGCTIQIDPQMNPETSPNWTEGDLRHTLIHEIGHCFGLQHDSDEKQIMFWEYHSDQNTSASFEYFIRSLTESRRLYGR